MTIKSNQIEMYAGDEYQDVARSASDQLDDLGARYGANARIKLLEKIFRDATRLEIAFWRMGLNKVY